MKEFMIPLKGLKDGEHHFEYHIGSSFFKAFECETILDSNLDVEVKVTRRESHSELKFDIIGTLTVPCDRCLDPLEIECKVKDTLIVKFGHAYEEINEELITIPEKEGVLDISQYIYEYALLSVPTHNVHKKKANCNQEMLDILSKHSVTIEENKNSLWDELKDILENN